MRKMSIKKCLFSLIAVSMATGGFCENVEALDSFPVGRAISNQVEVYRAAMAVMEGYNNHVRQVKEENKNAEVAKAFSAITTAGILDVPFRFPTNNLQKTMRAHLLTISSYLVKNQETFSNIRPDAAFCVLQNTLYLYPSVKFQKTELDKIRRDKVLNRSLRMCPGKMKKVR